MRERHTDSRITGCREGRCQLRKRLECPKKGCSEEVTKGIKNNPVVFLTAEKGSRGEASGALKKSVVRKPGGPLADRFHSNCGAKHISPA